MTSELDYKELEKLSAEEIENIRVEKVKDLQTTREVLSQLLTKKYKIVHLKSKLKTKELEVSENINKTKTVIGKLDTQEQILRSKFWEKKQI